MKRRNFIAAAAAAPWVITGGLARASAPVRIGLPLPITGVQSAVASELLSGYRLAGTVARRAGIELDFVIEDDNAKAKMTAAAVQKFGQDRTIAAVTGLVGTPHAKAAIPEARSANVPIIGIRSGARDLRDGGPMVYHLRASYEAELTRMLGMLSSTIDTISVVYSDDDFGHGALAHLRSIAQERGVKVAAAIAAKREGDDVRAATLRAVNPSLRSKALVVLMITRPTIEALQTARSNAFIAPTMAMSFTATAELKAAGGDAVRGLGLVSAFPVPRAAPDETTVAFRHAVAGDSELAKLVESVTAYEGFVYGTTIARAVAKCEGRVSRESLMQAMTSAPRISIAGEALKFDRQMVARQYLEALYFDWKGQLRA